MRIGCFGFLVGRHCSFAVEVLTVQRLLTGAGDSGMGREHSEREL